MQQILKPIHPFPARMAPSIVWEYLVSKKKLRVLDPMVGSGTTVTIARFLGHEAHGIDTDPLAVMISSAWSSNLDDKKVRAKTNQILAAAKKSYPSLTSRKAFPKNCDKETQDFINYWFDLKNRKELTCLSNQISKVKDNALRQILWAAFSKMIITKTNGVSLAMDVSHSRPHKVYSKAPCSAFDIFLKSMDSIITRSPFTDKELFNLPIPKIINGDSRQMPYPSKHFDLIITSPPYLNAIDYFRASKLSLVWMGKSISEIRRWRSNNIGSELMIKTLDDPQIKKASSKITEIDKLPSREKGFAFRYLIEMDKVMREIGRVLKPNGKVIMVVGNSTLKKVYVNNSDAIIELGSNYGLRLVNEIERLIPDNRRYLPSPSHKKSGQELKSRMKTEVIIEFLKK